MKKIVIAALIFISSTGFFSCSGGGGSKASILDANPEIEVVTDATDVSVTDAAATDVSPTDATAADVTAKDVPAGAGDSSTDTSGGGSSGATGDTPSTVNPPSPSTQGDNATAPAINNKTSNSQLLITVGTDGIVSINGEKIVLVNTNSDTPALADGIADFTVTDSKGSVVEWYIDENGNIRIKLPENYSETEYTISFESNGREYTVDALINEDGSVAVSGTSSKSDETVLLNLQTGHITVNGDDRVFIDGKKEYVISELKDGVYVLSDSIDEIIVKNAQGVVISAHIDPLTGDLVTADAITYPASITIVSGGVVTTVVVNEKGEITAASGDYLLTDTANGAIALPGEGGTSVNVAVQNDNGNYVLPENISISAVDTDGKSVTVTVDPATGDLVTQSEPSGPVTITITDSTSGNVYTVTVSESGEAAVTASYTVVDLINGTFVYDKGTEVASDDLSFDLAVVDDGKYTLSDDYEIEILGPDGKVIDAVISIDPVTGNISSDVPIDGPFTLVIKTEDGVEYTINFDENGSVSSVSADDTVVVLDSGSLTVADGLTLDIADQELVSYENGLPVYQWQLSSGTIISAVDESGNPVTVTIDPQTGNIVADHVVDGAIVLTVTTADGIEYTVKIGENGIIASDNKTTVEYTFDTINGKLGTSENSPVIVVGTAASYTFSDEVTITVKDAGGNVIGDEDNFVFDANGNLIFVPDDPSAVPAKIVVQTENITYTYTVTEGTQLSAPTLVYASADGGNGTGGGIGTTEGTAVQVEDGVIIVNVDENDNFVIQGENIEIPEGAVVDITVTDSDGNELEGDVMQDADGNYVFVPDPANPLVSGGEYEVTVTVNGTEYTETVIISLDNVNGLNSKFSSAKGYAAGTFGMSSLLNDDGEAIFGWDFETAYSFNFTMQNMPSGASAYITAYGVYEIEGHEGEVYYQRWSATGLPVKDCRIAANSTFTMNPEDAAIQKSDGSYYEFSKTYVEIVIKDAAGNDITATSGATLLIQ